MSSPGLSVHLCLRLKCGQDRLNEVKDLGPEMQVVLECDNEIPFDLASGQAWASPQPVLTALCRDGAPEVRHPGPRGGARTGRHAQVAGGPGNDTTSVGSLNCLSTQLIYLDSR